MNYLISKNKEILSLLLSYRLLEKTRNSTTYESQLTDLANATEIYYELCYRMCIAAIV